MTLVYVWYAPITWLLDNTLRQRCWELLDATEQATHQRLRVSHAQDSYLLAHALCRVALSQCAPTAPAHWRFTKDSKGKPTLLGASALQFNISHCKTLVTVAVSDALPVGIDVEDAHRSISLDTLGPRVLNAREMAACKQHRNPTLHFLRHWTLKEAYLKAQGMGVSERLLNIDMQLDPSSLDAPVSVQDSRPNAPLGPWYLRFVPTKSEHVLAVAAPVDVHSSRLVWSDGWALLNA